ncbi:hypothetical protein P7C70_g35, partial [Phenoliferia sp. Uapishka_3]
MSKPVEILSVKSWNETLREATATGATVIVDFHAECQISAMPTFLAIKAGQVVDTMKGADPQGLVRLVGKNAGPNPPVAPLPTEAETAKAAGNVHFETSFCFSSSVLKSVYLLQAFFKAADYSSAVEKYSEAIKIAPTSAVLYGNRSMSHLKNTPPALDLALSDAQKATDLEPKWGKGWVRLGEALEAAGELEPSANAFAKAVELAEGLVKTEAKQKLAAVKTKLGWH